MRNNVSGVFSERSRPSPVTFGLIRNVAYLELRWSQLNRTNEILVELKRFDPLKFSTEV